MGYRSDLDTKSYLGIKYGPAVFEDFDAFRIISTQEKTIENLQQKGIRRIDIFEVHDKQTPEKIRYTRTAT